MDLPEIVTALRAAGCVFAEEEARLLAEAAAGPAELAELVSRRVAGLPLEQVVGWAEFCGLRFSVRPGVFVPRKRTELLVRQAVSLTRPGSVVLDLCCGTGAIGGAIARAVPGVELHAVDVDPVAVECARGNLTGLGSVHEGDLYRALPPALKANVDIIVCNAPYVPTDEIARMPPEARDHEPRHALDGGHDGLEIQRRVLGQAWEWLRPKGYLMIETSRKQSAETAEAFGGAGFGARIVVSEELDATIVVGSLQVHRQRGGLSAAQ